MNDPTLSDAEFRLFRDLIFQVAGISLSDAKKVLVAGRLGKRARLRGMESFAGYFELLRRDRVEWQTAVDLLTTNETYFFREPAHMDYLAAWLAAEPPRGMFRLWSAASSSGEEAYSLAMVLADRLGEGPWEVLGSDISTRVLDRARDGLYSLERAGGIPRPYLSRFCLKGIDEQAGKLLIGETLRRRVSFRQVNLLDPPAGLGLFDAIFLRNVMIYFNQDTKRRVVANLLPYLRPGGHLIIGHSESLNGVTDALAMLKPSIYRKPKRDG